MDTIEICITKDTARAIIEALLDAKYVKSTGHTDEYRAQAAKSLAEMQDIIYRMR